MSGVAIFTFLLEYRSNESRGSNGAVCFSIQRSGIVNGSTHVMAFAGEASAVAVAAMFTVLMPKYCATSVETGLPWVASRYTVTRTRLFCPVGLSGNWTSPALMLTGSPITLFALEAVKAFITAGPLALRSVQLL